MATQEAFEKLKKVLASDLALIHYDPKKKNIMAADVSSYGMGAVLLHELPDGTKRPIMTAASSFMKAEKNYPQIQREALALMFALKEFHRYIYCRKFELQTDHQPLLAIFGVYSKPSTKIRTRFAQLRFHNQVRRHEKFCICRFYLATDCSSREAGRRRRNRKCGDGRKPKVNEHIKNKDRRQHHLKHC